MRIAKIIGKVTLSRSHPTLKGLSLRVGVPLSLEDITTDAPPQSDCLVLVDQLGAGLGSLIALAESMEAAAPFLPDKKPLDAYNAAILDDLGVS